VNAGLIPLAAFLSILTSQSMSDTGSPHDVAVVWFRNDLRVHDNEALAEAATADRLLPVYVFDPRQFGRVEYGSRDSFRYTKTGAHRTRFLIESVRDLRSSLRTRGSDLLVRTGEPESVLTELATAVDADAVYFHTYPTPEESVLESTVKDRLRAAEVTPQGFWGHTLYHINDLPGSAYDVDDTYTPFRKNLERNATVRETVDAPSVSVPDLPAAVEEADGLGPGDVPGVTDLDPELTAVDPDERGVLPFEGGETAALSRLETYLWEGDRLRRYKKTRNRMLGADYSSKFSAWLNAGCLSPRRVYEEVKRYEDERVSNDSTYWLVFELLWRDFFQFQFLKHGIAHFTREGIRNRTDIDWRSEETEFRRWARGETGIPFIDANVRELNRTGYMSNRGRQNVASFFANNLRLDWRRGAAYFETQLVDYDPCSNYGNWAYIAGVGNDSRNRYFNILKQARKYDGNAEYVKHWLPELADLPPEYAHKPWQMGPQEQAQYGVELGIDYPRPMVDLEASYRKLR
jgi:deoxyribodipyrimidine photo-lyase